MPWLYNLLSVLESLDLVRLVFLLIYLLYLAKISLGDKVPFTKFCILLFLKAFLSVLEMFLFSDRRPFSIYYAIKPIPEVKLSLEELLGEFKNSLVVTFSLENLSDLELNRTGLRSAIFLLEKLLFWISFSSNWLISELLCRCVAALSAFLAVLALPSNPNFEILA
jgi:hypothetical protein